MRLAVFSDVHGNLTALEAVLDDIGQRSVGDVVFAGDLCMVGPRPGACIRALQAANIDSLYGNTDDWVLGRQDPPAKLSAIAQWTLERLSPVERKWLDALPFAHRFSPTGKSSDELLIVHANPIDVNQIIFPTEEEQQALYGCVRQTDADLGGLLAGIDAAGLAFGHLHIPNERSWKQLELFNISSVSMPGDGDTRAKYGLLTWDGQAWSYESVRVAYDTRREIEAYQQHQPPGWENIVETMEAEGCFPQRV